MASSKKTAGSQAREMLFFFNHPSGDRERTREDLKITEKMKQIGRMVKIPLKDHVIIEKDWFSFFERDCEEEG